MSTGHMLSRLFSQRTVIRLFIVFAWLSMFVVFGLLPRPLPHGLPSATFWLFRITAFVASVYVIYETSEYTNRRAAIGGILLDVALVLPMWAALLLAWILAAD